MARRTRSWRWQQVMEGEEAAEAEERRKRYNQEKRLRRKLARAKAALRAWQRSFDTGLPYKTPHCIQVKSMKRKEQRVRQQARKQAAAGDAESTTPEECAVNSAAVESPLTLAPIPEGSDGGNADS